MPKDESDELVEATPLDAAKDAADRNIKSAKLKVERAKDDMAAAKLAVEMATEERKGLD